MKKLCFIFFAVTLITQSPTIIAQNLIFNPGCEDSLVNGEIPYWTEVIGTNWTPRGNNPLPSEGNYYFFAGVGSIAELQQDVDVSFIAAKIDSNIQYFNFEGYVRAYDQNPSDHSRIILEYLDTLKTTKLDSIDLGEYNNTNVWFQVTDSTLAPVGTRFIRIRLISTRYAGSNNDGYYDGLSLIAGSSAATTFQLTVSINDGWNMVSVPGLHPVDQDVDTWWSGKDLAANVFKYSGGYIAVTTVTPTEGYWMKNSGAQVYNYSEIQIVAHNQINGEAGWNLIGGYEDTVETAALTTNPPGLIEGAVYKYSGGYQVATNLVPGCGYWIKLSGAGQINIPEVLTKVR